MIEKEERQFKGFSRKTLKFLRGLKANNDKAWFLAHKADYEKYLLGPFRDLVTDMGDFVLGIDPCFEITPAINKTISRIYRDTRFSKDKSLYRSSMWFSFKNQNKDWMTLVCGYFFELNINSYRYGMGFYNAAPAIMSKFREMIDEDPKEFDKAISFLDKQKTFVLEGDKYKRIFDKTKPERIQNWYQRKNVCLICNRKIDDVLFSSRLVDELVSGFSMMAPFYHYLEKVRIKAQEC